MLIPHKIAKQIDHLPAATRKRIQNALRTYDSADKKKLWFMGDNVSRVRCGKFRIVVRDERGKEPEVMFIGLRNDVYRRAPSVK